MPPYLLVTCCGTSRILMRVRNRHGERDRDPRLRTRSGTGSESGTDTLEFLPCGASHRLVDPICFI